MTRITHATTRSTSALPEIGSDFELVEDHLLTQEPVLLPWEAQGPHVYVESGRQALALVADELTQVGATSLVLPAYFCDSMIEPFVSRGWTVATVPVDSFLRVRPSNIETVESDVYMHTPYFGRRDTQEELEALSSLRRRGVRVIVDETHRVLEPGSSVADYRVASLRKLLPLYDGGYATGVPPIACEDTEPRPALLRQQAMAAKSNFRTAGKASRDHRGLFAEAERLVDSRLRPSAMSAASRSLMHHLSFSDMKRRRIENARTLASGLDDVVRVDMINPPNEVACPSHLVLRVPDPLTLQRTLAKEGVYCPIHWPPSVLVRSRVWCQQYISMPIDHRYHVEHMRRVASLVATAIEKR